jgi:uncharacterized protein
LIVLTEEMSSSIATALSDGAPVMVASASRAGMPDIAFKGSVMVWDSEHLAYWERARGQTLRNLQENPQACLLYRNPKTRLAWKFFGEATVLDSGNLRQQIMDRTIDFELQKDPERQGAAVLVRIDRVLQAGQVLMERD